MVLKVYAHDATDFENNGLAIIDATNIKVTRELNGDYRLSFSLPNDYGKWAYLKQGNIIVCEEQWYRIYKKTRQKAGILKRDVECLHIIADASQKFIPYFEAQYGKTPREVMLSAFENTPFEVMSVVDVTARGMEWVTDLTDIMEQSKTTPKDILNVLLTSLQKGELYIDNYKVALVERIGADTGLTASLAVNLKSINDNEDGTNIITRLYAFGKDDGALHTDLAPNGYVDSPEGINLFGIREGYKSYDTIDDQNELLAKAQYEFSSENPYRIDLPDLSYTISLVELSKIYGSAYTIRLGDSMRIKDNTLSIETTQRIVKYEYYPYSNQQSNVVLGRPQKTLGNMLNSLQGTENDYKKIVTSSGEVKSEWLENLVKKLNTWVNGILGTREIVQHKTGDLWIDPSNANKALLITDSVIAIANSKNQNGDWAWTTFGTADGFTADVINAGTLNTNLVKIQSTNGTITIENGAITIQHTDGSVSTLDAQGLKVVHKTNNYTLFDATGMKRFIDGQMIPLAWMQEVIIKITRGDSGTNDALDCIELRGVFWQKFAEKYQQSTAYIRTQMLKYSFINVKANNPSDSLLTSVAYRFENVSGPYIGSGIIIPVYNSGIEVYSSTQYSRYQTETLAYTGAVMQIYGKSTWKTGTNFTNWGYGGTTSSVWIQASPDFI